MNIHTQICMYSHIPIHRAHMYIQDTPTNIHAYKYIHILFSVMPQVNATKKMKLQ